MGGVGIGETCTLNPRKPAPEAANKMNCATGELNIIGHWPVGPRMDERYDRTVRPCELFFRDAIIQKVASGWDMVWPFRLPGIATGSARIGNPTALGTSIPNHLR